MGAARKIGVYEHLRVSRTPSNRVAATRGGRKQFVARSLECLVLPDSNLLSWNCCVKGILGTGGVMDKCVQMLDKELWRLGPDGSVCFGVLCANRTREERENDGREERERRKGKKPCPGWRRKMRGSRGGTDGKPDCYRKGLSPRLG
ncbi:hypothetical protein TNCV_4128421 [Trichonephila clavipes]|nr:hypothetical protein TNCV_4128421 [Trichonephila clavipes]